MNHLYLLRYRSLVGLSCCLLTFLAGCRTDAPDESVAMLPTPREAGDVVEALSLSGAELHRLELGEDGAQLQHNLDSALAAYEADPSADNLIWVGRRYGYLWRYRDAVDVFTAGIEAFPDDPRFLRHRGHRYITLRDFEAAEADLARAAEMIAGTPDEVEPDGAPNPSGIPTSTLHFNIWYHLGLAQYLQGDFEAALESYRACMAVSDNNDARVATSDWMYMTLRRLGREEEAAEVLGPITADLEILENGSYHRRLLMYKGEIPPEEILNPEGASSLDIATQGYGVGNWHLYNGRVDEARSVFERVLSGEYWAAFGYIAAEADLSRVTGNG